MPNTPVEQMDLAEQLRRNLNVSSLEHTFANWLHLPGTDVCYRAFLALATRDDARPFLLCYGGVGNGKTYLLEATAIELRQRGRFLRIVRYPVLLGNLKRAMDGQIGLTYQDLLENYCRAGILLLDDVGMGTSDTKWSYAILEEIIVYRFAQSLMTALTTNLDIKDLPERVISRFRDKTMAILVLNEGKDYRRIRKDD